MVPAGVLVSLNLVNSLVVRVVFEGLRLQSGGRGWGRSPVWNPRVLAVLRRLGLGQGDWRWMR